MSNGTFAVAPTENRADDIRFIVHDAVNERLDFLGDINRYTMAENSAVKKRNQHPAVAPIDFASVVSVRIYQ